MGLGAAASPQLRSGSQAGLGSRWRRLDFPLKVNSGGAVDVGELDEVGERFRVVLRDCHLW